MELCSFNVSDKDPFFLIAGPCVIESEATALETSEQLREAAHSLKVPFIYKSSFDKANRSSPESYRGPGLEEGLRILQRVRDEVGVPVLTDVHEDTPLDEVGSVVSVLQTPAFLCRQTNFIQSVCAQGLPVNIKKGQFLAPLDMCHVVDKAKAGGNEQIMVCERGASFGYNNPVSDMRSLLDETNRLSGRLRRYSFGSDARRSRQQVRRSKRNGACVGTRRNRGGCCGVVYGDAPTTG
ncbi:MAG: hypothetical protein Ct9H300mP8_09310 [Gammaproteobacteria bacterium]|nr:MAG: hypothetical protein Ct9H300mP8_09310 [Gammaproteobacteria bacterium]